MGKPLLYGPTGRPLIHRRRQNATTWDFAWDAAKRSGYRGWFYFPDLDPSTQMPEQTRRVIAQKANWLYNNMGAVSAVIDGLGLDEVDTGLWPKSTSSNAHFNKAATDSFHHQCGNSRIFHSAAVEDYYSAQWLVRRSIRLYGDLFGQLLRPGTAARTPQMHFIPSWQVADSAKAQDEFRDGVRRNRLGRAVEYRILTAADRSASIDVPADDLLPFHDKFWTNQTRGMSGLAPVVRKLFSLDDIEKAETSGTLLRTRVAYAIVSKEDAPSGPMLAPGVTDVEEIPASEGSSAAPLLVQKIVARDGSEIDVADLPAGKDIKLVESSRASVASEYSKFLLVDVAHSTLYPPEYVFFLGGLSQGTVTRLVQNRAQRVSNTIRQFQLIPQFCSRWYLFWLWQSIKAGIFDEIPGGVPADWYRHKIICPPDMTVDAGREGRLYDERLATGKMSGQRYHGMNGEDEEDVEDEVIEAAIRRRKKVEEAASRAGVALTYNDVFPPPTGSAAAAASNEQTSKDVSGDEQDE